MTEKQKAFVAEYLIDLNATKAALRAGYSEKNAGNIGSENLEKPEIQAEIQKALQERQRRTGITQDKVVSEIAKVAFEDASDASESKLRYGNKLKALEMLAKHLGMFDQNRQATVQSANNLLDAIRETEVNADAVPEAE